MKQAPENQSSSMRSPLLFGGRSFPEIVREGKDEALLEARFDSIDLPLLNDFPSSEWLILKRILSKSGKNRTYLNHSFANLSTLKEVGQRLTEIHGQHEHHNLTNLEWQLNLLDAFGGLSEQKETGMQTAIPRLAPAPTGTDGASKTGIGGPTEASVSRIPALGNKQRKPPVRRG
ncbi:MAG: hypothetical protein MPW15_22155 [Candidatus Manganitrophus sp.]|nr:hypothetical protein [Candidatus Manganitrophus sp.]